jgi:hypothetical protein
MSDVREQLADLDPELLLMDGFDDAVVGVISVFGQEPVVAYDREKVIALLEEQGMTREDAEEFHSYNQAGLYAGEKTWAFLDRLEGLPNG